TAVADPCGTGHHDARHDWRGSGTEPALADLLCHRRLDGNTARGDWRFQFGSPRRRALLLAALDADRRGAVPDRGSGGATTWRPRGLPGFGQQLSADGTAGWLLLSRSYRNGGHATPQRLRRQASYPRQRARVELRPLDLGVRSGY